MRVVKVVLTAASSLVAFFASIMTLLVGVSRLVNAPHGVEAGLWASVFVTIVGISGAILVFFLPYYATVALGVAAGLSITTMPPDNGLLAALFAGSAVLALAVYFAGNGFPGENASRQHTRT